MKADEQDSGVLKDTAQSISHYWFAYGSPTALGVFRILMSSLTVLSLLLMSLDWDAWFSEKGYVPARLGQVFINSRVNVGFGTNWTIPRIDVLNGITDPRVSLLFYSATVLAGIFTALGLWTRISSIAFVVGLVSIQHRNAAILAGYDTVMRVCCMYIAIAPSGAACSLDRLLGIWKGKLSTAPVLVSMWPQRLITYNVALLYLTTTWLKWGGGMWQNGTATYYPVRLAEFFRFPMPKWVNDFPMVYVSTYGTMAAEFSLGTLVFFRPLRKYVLLCGVLMHLHIELSMNVPLFSYLMVSTYVCFYDGEEVSSWARRLGSRLKKLHVEVALPSGMQLTPRGAALLDSLDPLKLVHYGPGTAEHWTATKLDDRTITATKAIWTRSLGSWCFGWIPGIWAKILAKAIEPIPEEVEHIPKRGARHHAKAPR